MKRTLLFLFVLLIPLLIKSQVFTEITEPSGIQHYYQQNLNMGGGVIFFDANGDGYDDIYLTSGFGEDKYYENNQNGTFTDKTEIAGLKNIYGLYTTGAISGDIDNDGDKDLFVTTWFQIEDDQEEARNLFYENQGNGVFIEKGLEAGFIEESFSMACTMLDYNLDGLLDIYVGNYVLSGTVIQGDLICRPNQLYENNGDGTFTNVAEQFNLEGEGCTLAVKAMDWNQDYDLDIYVANDFGGYDFVPPNDLYDNSDGLFNQIASEVNADVEFYAMGIANGDYDLDGDLDIYVTNLGKNALLRYDNGVYSHQEDFAGVGNEFTIDPPGTFLTTGWGTVFFDYDNNLWSDLFVANGRVPAGEPVPFTGEQDPCKLYVNNEDGTFTDYTAEAGVGDMGRGRGMAMSDFDNDGDLDVFVVNQDANPEAVSGPYSSRFFRNDSNNNNNYLKVTLEGTVNNRDGYGALVKLYVGDYMLMREHSTGGSHCSQHSSTIHFGLGEYTAADEIQVIWPGGQIQTITPADIDLSANQTIHIVEQAETIFSFSSFHLQRAQQGILVTWSGNSISNNLGFDVQRSNNAVDFTTIGHVNPNVENQYSFLDSSAESGIEYTYRIRQNSTNNSVFSDLKTIIYFGESGFPLNVSPVGNSLELLWTSPTHPDISSFELYRSTTSTGTAELIDVFSGGQSQYIFLDDSIQENQIYYYYLSISIDDHPEIESARKYGYLISSDNTTLQAISGNDKIGVRWQNQFEWEDCYYLLERKEINQSSYSIIQTINVDDSQSYSFNDFTATSMKSYEYRVKLIDGFGREHISNSDFAMVVPPEQVDLSATVINNAVVELTWNGNAEHNTIEYILERKTIGQSQFMNLELIMPNALPNYTTIDDTVDQGNSYTYRVKQIDAYGGEVLSHEVDVQIDALDDVWVIVPNPTSNLLILQSPQLKQVTRFEIIDSAGRLLMTINNEGIHHTIVLDVRELANGYYYIRAIDQTSVVDVFGFMKK